MFPKEPDFLKDGMRLEMNRWANGWMQRIHRWKTALSFPDQSLKILSHRCSRIAFIRRKNLNSCSGSGEGKLKQTQSTFTAGEVL